MCSNLGDFSQLAILAKRRTNIELHPNSRGDKPLLLQSQDIAEINP